MESETKLLDQARLVLRLKHMSYRTEIAYLSTYVLQRGGQGVRSPLDPR